MKLKIFRHLWGVKDPWEQSFPRFAAKGYDGIETHLPAARAQAQFARQLARHRLECITQIFTGGRNVREHLQSYRRQLAHATRLNPRLINCHGGRDGWSVEESRQFYAEALRIEADLGVVVAHETHRGRVFYNPWTTVRLLEQFETLRLCCDFSHWVCVCERLFDDTSILQLCAQRCVHIHARIGYEEGPQVPDPRAPEFQKHLAAHERWWRMIWREQRRRGLKTSTLTPEFGPPPYLHTLPFTQQPVADLEAICDWQAERQRASFRRQRP
jgi:sugar phosphate isomerase/epimerase